MAEDQSANVHFMAGYFKWSTAIQQAVIADDIPRARTYAGRMAAHKAPADMPVDWNPYIAKVRKLALQVQRSELRGNVALNVGRLAGVCGECHRDVGANVHFEVPEHEQSGFGLERSMRQHDWAAAVMWRALISGSDELWKRGADRLADSPLHPDELEGRALSDTRARKYAAVLRQAAVKARDAEAAERPAAYGELLNSCGQCHRALSVLKH